VNHEAHRVHDHRDHHDQDQRLEHPGGHRQNHRQHHRDHQVHRVGLRRRRDDRRRWHRGERHRGVVRIRDERQVQRDERQDVQRVVVGWGDP